MHSSSRNGAKVIWLAVHTTEGIMRAKDLRDWKAWAGSSHASNDETGVLMTPRDGFVPYDRAAWTLRNGNAISENIEQCGWARWTRTEWLARPKLLETTALWLADRARARGIPLRLLTPAEIRGRRTPGVLGHGDYSTATGDGTHWDPGPGYPWDVVLGKANWLLNPTPAPTARPAPVTQQEDDDMFDANDRGLLRDLHTMLGAFKGGGEKDFYQPFFAEAAAKGTAQQIAALTGSLNAIAEALRNGSGADGFTVDEAIAAGRAGAEAALAELGDKLRPQK